MNTYTIDPIIKEKMINSIPNFNFDKEKDIIKRQKRNEFTNKFNIHFLRDMRKENYFMGIGNKEGVFSYELEHKTRELGSIKGGSNNKFGQHEDFEKIKLIILDILENKNENSSFYEENGELKPKIKDICKRSCLISGFKSGRAVLGKILSLYFPEIFLPIFNHQDYFLNIIYPDYTLEFSGLELFLFNNYLLLKIKEDILKDEDFSELTSNGLSNQKFTEFLYYVLNPKDKTYLRENEKLNDEQIDALEDQHYQKLIHRNFKRLFPNLEYYNPEVQNSKNGHFDTETVGEIDFLCKDNKGDFIVIELKKLGKDKSLAQICRYMGWVKENLCENNEKVNGLIISENNDINLEYAIKVVPNVDFKKMKLNVEIKPFDNK